MRLAVVGGGIVGLTLALHLKRRGIDCTVYEAAPTIEPLGVGITLLPHAMQEFAALGLEDALRAEAIENRESAFFNRYGQLIYTRSCAASPPATRSPSSASTVARCTEFCTRQRCPRSAPSASSRITNVPALRKTTRRLRLGSARDDQRRSVTGCRSRRRDRLRRRQLDDSPPVLSGRGATVRRHQHVARRHAARADLRRPHVHAHRLDRDRQAGCLPDRRQTSTATAIS